MKSISKELSCKLSNLGFLFAAVVVFIHIPTVQTSGAIFLKNVFPGFLQGSANAWFFVVAGFFFASHVGEEKWWKDSILKRIKSLVVPFFTLNIIMLLLLLAYQGSRFCYPVSDAGAPIWKSVLRAIGLWTGEPVNSPTWFVRSLFLYVLTTPVLFWLLKSGRCATLFLVALFCANIITFERAFSCVGLASIGNIICSIYHPEFLFYFLAGSTMRMHGVDSCPVKVGVVAFILGFCLSIYAPMSELETNTSYLFGIAYNFAKPCLIIGMFTLVPSRPLPKVLTRNAFPIYLLHWQLITASWIIFGKLDLHNFIFGNPFFVIGYWIVVVGITIIMAEAIRKSQILSQLLFGGR